MRANISAEVWDMKSLRFRNTRGMTIAVVLIILVVLILIALATAAIGSRNLGFVRKESDNTRAFYAAEAGLSRAISKIKSNITWDGREEAEQGQDRPLTFQDNQMPNSGDTFTVYVYNNLFGSSAITGFRGIQVPVGNCYIISEGKSGNNSTKYVSAMVNRQNPFSVGGLVGKDSIRFDGNVSISAYDSDTQQAVPGGGDAATNGVQVGAVTVHGSAAYIDGKISSGPGSNLNTITTTGHPTITEGTDTLPNEVPFPAVTLPTLPSQALPSPLSKAPVTIASRTRLRYKFLLASRTRLPGMASLDKGNGNSSSSGNSGSTYNLAPGYHYTGTLTIRNNETVVLTGPGTYIFDGIDIAAQGALQVDTTGGPVKIYLDGNVSETGGSNAGDVINYHSGGYPKATDLLIYGTSKCTSMNIRGNASAAMGVYAPSCSINLHGNADFYGALVGQSVRVHGHPIFKYDVALGRLANDIQAVSLTCWQRF